MEGVVLAVGACVVMFAAVVAFYVGGLMVAAWVEEFLDYWRTMR
jgi:hypothetical protein